MKKPLLIAAILLAAVVVLGGAGLWFANANKQAKQSSSAVNENVDAVVAVSNDNTSSPSSNENSSTVANSSNSDTTNEKQVETFSSNYGYSLQYPSKYNNDKNFSVWTTSNVSDLLEEWGVNVGQETIFSITVFEKNKKSDVLNKYGYRETGENVNVGGRTAQWLEGQGGTRSLFIEGARLYLLRSSFVKSQDSPYYAEYQDILQSVRFE